MLKNVQSIAETKVTSSINEWFVEYQNSKPVMGLYQDSVIGAFEFTKSHNKGIHKFHAMRLCNRTSTDKPLKFDKQTYNSREIVSMFLPEINYKKQAGFYVPEFSPYITYKEDEINVLIQGGEFKTGVLDKASIGQKVEGSLFHVIYIEKGATVAIDALYNLQQLMNNSIYHKGVTFGLRDIHLSKKTREKMKLETAKIIEGSLEVAKQLEEGKLVPPIDMSLGDYYEEHQMSVLEHGDEFIKPIMEEIDTDNNWFYKFIYSGSKGDRGNMMSIFSAIGSIGIHGKRIKEALSGRTSINFQRHSSDPMARGYNPSNFIEGIPPATFPFSAQEARYELIEVALSTALAGTMNRNAVKNLEPIVTSNNRAAIKKNRLVQPLYGENGVDPRKVEKAKFPTIIISDTDFKDKYHVSISKLDKKYRNQNVQKALDQEFKAIKDDREFYRHVMLSYEAFTRSKFMMNDTLRMPVNPDRIISNVVELMASQKIKLDPLDPIQALEEIDIYIRDLGYVYMNEIQRKSKSEIPVYIRNAIALLRVLVRSHVCIANLLERGVNNVMLKMILDRITLKIISSLIDYGTSIGVIAAQSISEPITQYLLDAKHRSGLRKEKVNVIDRFDELMKNKATGDMSSPYMILVPQDQYKFDKQKVIEIANHIEMLPLSRFVESTKIFIEEFEHPLHTDFVHETALIKKFKAYNFGDKVPKDLINWCVRFVLKKEELILKSMKLKTIYFKLMERFPHLYIVHSQQNSEEIIMRIYMRNVMFKKGADINLEAINELTQALKNSIIRGIDGITNATVISLAHSYVTPDGTIDRRKMFVIETDGTNLSAVLENPYLNQYECNTSSIEEIETMYGIEAARNKELNEIQATINDSANYEHASIYADEMTYPAKVTSIQRSGLGKREVDNVLLRASFGSPIQVLQDAAINSRTDNIYGMSAPLILGTAPKFGTTFSDVCIDEDAVRENTKNVDDILNDL